MGALTDGQYMNDRLLPIKSKKKGMIELKYTLMPGQFMMEKLNIVAKTETKLGNPFITQKQYNLAAENRGY